MNQCTGPSSGAFSSTYAVLTGERSAAIGSDSANNSGPASVCVGPNPANAIRGAFTQGFYRFAQSGDFQRRVMGLGGVIASTDATALLVCLQPNERAILASERSWYCAIRIVARQDDGSSGYAERRVCIQRSGTATALVGTVQTIGTDAWDTALGTPTIAITADDANEALAITITQANTTSTRWAAVIDTVEVGY